MGRFDHKSNYTRNAGITSVLYGADSPVLEVELNEMQEIGRKRMTDFLSGFVGNSISDKHAVTYNGGVLSIGECTFVVGGDLIKCTGLSIAVSNGHSVYLKVKEMGADYVTALKEEGNQQSDTIVENNIKDPRYDYSTSMRTYLTYDLTLSTSELDGATYVKIATISDGVVVVDIEEASVGSGTISFTEEDLGEDEEWEV